MRRDGDDEDGFSLRRFGMRDGVVLREGRKVWLEGNQKDLRWWNWLVLRDVPRFRTIQEPDNHINQIQ